MSHICYLELEQLQAYGHHLNLIESVLGDMLDTGLFEGASFIGNADIDAEIRARLGRLRFDDIFAETPRVHLPNEPNNIPAVADALRRAIGKIRADDIVLYSNMPSPYVLLAIALAARGIPAEKKLRFIVRLAMTDEEWTWFESRLSAIINYISVTDTLRDRFLFTVESTRLQEYYQERTGYLFPIQFGPISRTLVLTTQDKWPSYEPDRGPFNIAFLGEAREEKGFQHLPAFVEHLAAALPTARFHIQCNASSVNNTPSIVETRNRLVALRDGDGPLRSRIVLYHSPLPHALYQAVLSKAHCVLLPYLAERYACRGSGVAFEGIQADAMILVTGNTDLEVTFNLCPATIPFDFTVPNLADAMPGLVRTLKEQIARKRGHPHDDLARCDHLLFSRMFFDITSLARMPRDTHPLAGSAAANARLDRELQDLRQCSSEIGDQRHFERLFAVTRIPPGAFS